MSTPLDTALDLIRIRSTVDQPGELHRAVAYVQEFFDTIPNLIIRTYEHNGKPAVVVSTKDTLCPDVLMVGHLDVVPAKDSLFEPEVADGRMIARGACDMKTEDAVMMHVLKTVAEDSKRPSVALMLTTDEEIGGMSGVQYLVDEIGYRCKVALVPDGGKMPEDIVVESKGVLHVRLIADGVSAHGAFPWKGENAIEKLIRAYQNIQKSFPETDPKEHWHTTCNLGTMNGGKATNQVPDHASCTLDIRHPALISRNEIVERVEQAALKCTVEVLVSADASTTSSNDPYLQRYVTLLQRMQNLQPRFCRNPSAHDGRFLTSHGIPVIISRPLSGEQHTDNEWVDLKSLEHFYQLYLAFVRSFA